MQKVVKHAQKSIIRYLSLIIISNLYNKHLKSFKLLYYNLFKNPVRLAILSLYQKRITRVCDKKFLYIYLITFKSIVRLEFIVVPCGQKQWNLRNINDFRVDSYFIPFFHKQFYSQNNKESCQTNRFIYCITFHGSNEK